MCLFYFYFIFYLPRGIFNIKVTVFQQISFQNDSILVWDLVHYNPIYFHLANSTKILILYPTDCHIFGPIIKKNTQKRIKKYINPLWCNKPFNSLRLLLYSVSSWISLDMFEIHYWFCLGRHSEKRPSSAVLMWLEWLFSASVWK